MSVHTTGDMGGSRRNVLAHPSPQVHLLVDSMEKMGWQKHTVRGFMAGAMKKAGYAVESFKPEGGERTYRINQ
jgi:Protein of unknown function (DUF3489)